MNETQQALKNRYPNIHPLIFHRAMERSTDDVELFDILEDLPIHYPIVWDNNKRRFITCENFMLQGDQ